MGFRDDRAEPFRQCCRILAELLEVNKDAVFMFENVVVAPHLQDDEAEQERLLNWKFETINAMDMGAPQSRPRRVAQNLVEAGEWEHRPPMDPNLFLERLGSWVTERHTNCVLASGANTESPIYVNDAETDERRKADLDKLEALQGAVVGSSTAHGHFEMEYKARAALIGNSFHAELVRALFPEMEPPSVAERTSSIHTVQAQEQRDGPPEMGKQEKELTSMNDEELERVLKERLGTEGLARYH